MRLVAVSDLHGYLPEIPACDLLIVAGDVCPDRFSGGYARERPELQGNWICRVFFPWLAGVPAARCVVTWGNHDWVGMSPEQSTRLRTDAPGNVTILVDALMTLPDGGSLMSIWASPWSNLFMQWAFMRLLANWRASTPTSLPASTSSSRTSHRTGLETVSWT
jgi:hypothetical protein